MGCRTFGSATTPAIVSLAVVAAADSLLALDWQHTCYRVWPARIGPDTIDPPGRPGWCTTCWARPMRRRS
ncbi:DUF2716 domain-containing protein [Asanoa siamensis]|uniref:Secreted peptide n=1 Tax=Asanoa siamensis TaxID=926357 RepID=A0ABQ4CLW6_9ACTN|nr:DUF2716 domain-containing protein [Asanoa siamensis]GIF72286.1 hypothetical protein Asi02nite_18040 [Asanoa siamensis]